MKNWYIVITEENHSELLKWWNDSVGNSIGCRPPSVGEYLMSKNPKDNSCFWTQTDTNHHGLNWQQSPVIRWRIAFDGTARQHRRDDH